jgi:hypothetical protein
MLATLLSNENVRQSPQIAASTIGHTSDVASENSDKDVTSANI